MNVQKHFVVNKKQDVITLLFIRIKHIIVKCVERNSSILKDYDFIGEININENKDNCENKYQ